MSWCLVDLKIEFFRGSLAKARGLESATLGPLLLSLCGAGWVGGCWLRLIHPKGCWLWLIHLKKSHLPKKGMTSNVDLPVLGIGVMMKPVFLEVRCKKEGSCLEVARVKPSTRVRSTKLGILKLTSWDESRWSGIDACNEMGVDLFLQCRNPVPVLHLYLLHTPITRLCKPWASCNQVSIHPMCCPAFRHIPCCVLTYKNCIGGEVEDGLVEICWNGPWETLDWHTTQKTWLLHLWIGCHSGFIPTMLSREVKPPSSMRTLRCRCPTRSWRHSSSAIDVLAPDKKARWNCKYPDPVACEEHPTTHQRNQMIKIQQTNHWDLASRFWLHGSYSFPLSKTKKVAPFTPCHLQLEGVTELLYVWP